MDESLMNSIKKSFQKYENVAKEFQKFFNKEELSAAFDRKADIEMINELNQFKATKTQIEETKKLIDNLNFRLKHISIVQREIATLLEPSKNSFNHFDA